MCKRQAPLFFVYLLARLLLSASVLFSTYALCENEHEHIGSLPYAENFLTYWEQIKDLPVVYPVFEPRKLRDPTLIDSLKFKRLFDYLTQALQVPEKVAERIAKYLHPEMTLGELVKLGEGYFKPKDLFTLTHLESMSHEEIRIGYVHTDSIRKEILVRLDTETFLGIFREYFKAEPVENRRTVNLVLPGDLQMQREKMVRLKQLGFHFDTWFTFDYSFLRKSFLSSSVGAADALIGRAREYYKNDVLDGIDLTGSIFENERDLENIKKSRIKDRLERLFKLAHELNVPLRFHAFEQDNTSKFYQVLEEVLKNPPHPVTLRIGHVAKLNPHWIELLAQYDRSQKCSTKACVAIEFSPVSERLLGGVSDEHLLTTMKRVQEAGLRVAFGTDGLGLFGSQASISEQRMALYEARMDFRGSTNRCLVNFEFLVL